MQSFIKPIAVLGFTSILAACGGGTGDDSGGETPEQPTNTAPVANGGTSQTVTAGSEVSLNGSQSSDADGDSLTYSWSITSQPSGSTATLTTGQQANASFTPEVSGSYEVTLTVSDGTATDTATVTITVNAIVEQNAAPIANAGSNQAVVTGTQVTLNGDQSSDADGDNLTYGWSITSQPSGSNASLSNSEQVTTSFTPSLSGNYQVRLTVSDGTDS
ncbi:MAG: PKD domain-containing protein, partial [Gammaproteobacteria bacterium]|nr:PKD domain-containing protein [Gammaproteobacteria bacterium]